jgi:hypothetical protein
MGFFRNLYREARDIIGLKPPAENETQLAERVCDEVRGEIGGKKTKAGDDWLLKLDHEGRSVEILFEAAGTRALFTISSELEGGPAFVLYHDPSGGKEAAPKGLVRINVAGGVFVEGEKADVQLQEKMWKALPTGTRANLSGLLTRHKGAFGYEDASFKFGPETPTLNGPSAKYNVKTLLTTLVKSVDEIETAWNAL